MTKSSTGNFFNKKFLWLLISALGIWFIVFTTGSNGALLPNIPNLTKTANPWTEAGKNAVFVPPYSIGKIQADNGKYMYFINLAEATAFVPSTRTWAGVNFSCDDTNHINQKLVSTERRRAILNKIISSQQGGLMSWMSTTDSSQSPSGQTGEAFRQGILNNATSFFNPAPAGNTGVSADSTINVTIINKIKQATQQLGLSSPGFVMACGCKNPDIDEALLDTTKASFPPYRQETYRTTLNPSDSACEARQATCNPTSGKFDNITSTGIRYRWACALPTQMTETGSCVLKRFLYGVINNSITYSKIRAAMTGASTKDTENTLPYAYKYPMGYGQLKNVHYGSNGYRSLPFPNPSYYSSETGILTNVILFENYPGSSDNVAEFSLLGITPQTEGTNRGCLPDGTGYRVNSKVYSRQLVAKGFQHDIAWSLYMWWPNYYDGYMQHYPLFSSSQPKDISFAERDRNLDYRGDTRAVRNDVNTHSYPYKTYTYGIPDYEGNYQMTNKLYGCQAELLPNPDLYCVERVVRTATNANTLYFKEFTKEYTGDKTCSSLTLFTTTGATRSLLNKEDAGYGTSTRDNTHIIFSSTEYLPWPGGWPSQLMNGIFNTTPEYQPATNIFGIPLKNNPAVESYTFGINATQATHGVKIPLKDGQYSLYEIEWSNAQNKRSVVAKNAPEARAEICKQMTGQPCSSIETSSVIFQTVGTAISTDVNFIQKNVCYASKPCEIINPNGKNTVVLNGRAGTFYSVSTAPDDHLCSEYAQVKTCSNGAPLTGYTTCKDSLFTIVITKIEQIVESILP